MIENENAPSGHPKTKQPRPEDVLIGIDRGASPLEDLPKEISQRELSKRADLAKVK